MQLRLYENLIIITSFTRVWFVFLVSSEFDTADVPGTLF